MKILFTILLMAFAAKFSYSQNMTTGAIIMNPDKWTFAVQNSSGDEATLLFTLKLDNGWHVYSQNTPDGGPLPMVYKFDANECYELIGKCVEPKPHEEFDSTFGVAVYTYDKEVTFSQKIKLKNKDCKVHGTIEYQVCKEACIFKDAQFDFDLKR